MNIKTVTRRLLVVGVLAGLGYAGVATLQASRAVDSARRENMELKARQETLREEAFELGVRAADAVELARWIARPAGASRQGQPRMACPPSRDASIETIIAWLSSASAQLETAEHDLSEAVERTGSGTSLASAPAGAGEESSDEFPMPGETAALR